MTNVFTVILLVFMFINIIKSVLVEYSLTVMFQNTSYKY